MNYLVNLSYFLTYTWCYIPFTPCNNCLKHLTNCSILHLFLPISVKIYTWRYISLSKNKKKRTFLEKSRYSNNNTNPQWKSPMGSGRSLASKLKSQFGSSNLYLINESWEEKKAKKYMRATTSWNVAGVSHENKHKKVNQKINPLEKEALYPKYWQSMKLNYNRSSTIIQFILFSKFYHL